MQSTSDPCLDYTHASQLNSSQGHSTKRRKPGTPDTDNATIPSSMNMAMSQDQISKFLLLSLPEGHSFTKISPFQIDSYVVTILGAKPTSVKILRSGNVLVECSSEQAAKLFAGQMSFQGKKVTVTYHATLNSIRGVIRSNAFDYVPDNELLEDLKPQGITEVRRLTKPAADDDLATPRPATYLLSFSLPDLPEFVYILYRRYRVRAYWNGPLRCRNCLQYGHSEPCKKPKICTRCAAPLSDSHNAETCNAQIKCAVCHTEDHSVTSPTCPRYKQECKVMQHASSANISVNEARKDIRRFQSQQHQTTQRVPHYRPSQQSNQSSTWSEPINSVHQQRYQKTFPPLPENQQQQRRMGSSQEQSYASITASSMPPYEPPPVQQLQPHQTHSGR